MKKFLSGLLMLHLLASLYSICFGQNSKLEDAVFSYYKNEMDKALEMFNSLLETQIYLR